MIWMIISLLLTSSYESNLDIYEVEKADLFLKMLQQLNCSREMEDKFSTWGKLVQKNDLIFEDPVTNFLLISKLVEIGNKKDMVPAMMMKSIQRTVTIPSREKLRKSAVLLNEMMSMYNIPLKQEITIVTFKQPKIYRSYLVQFFRSESSSRSCKGP